MKRILTRFMSLAVAATVCLTTAWGQEASEAVAQVTYADGTKEYIADAKALTAKLERKDNIDLAFTLLQDVTLGDVTVMSPTTLDLKGHVIKGSLCIYSTVTIDDSGENGAIVTEGEDAVFVIEDGALTVNGGRFEGTDDGLLVFGDTATINGGTFVGKYGIYIGSNITVTINGGTANGTNEGVFVYGTAIINGGTFKGGNDGLYVYGTAVINGGTFEGNKAGMYVQDTAKLYGGTFNGGIVSNTDATFILDNGYVYKDNEGVAYTELKANTTYPDGSVKLVVAKIEAEGNDAEYLENDAFITKLGRNDKSELKFTLLRDVQFGDESVMSPTTIDLNGHVIKGSLYIYSTVTIDDSGENGAIVTEGADAVYARVGGVLTVNGGTFEGYDGVCIGGGTATINGGTFEGRSGINVATGGTATINDGTFNGSLYGLYVGGTATINDGTFEGGVNGLKVEGAGTATINGGTFKGRLGGMNVDGTANLYGGTFYVCIVSDRNATVNLGNGYMYKDNEGDIYTELSAGFEYPDGSVKLVVAKIESEGNDAEYADIDAFFEKLERVDNSELKITLLQDVTFEDVTVASPTTLDLNGRKIKGVLSIRSTVTIDDSGENGAIVTEEEDAVLVIEDGALTINGGTFEGSDDGVFVSGGTATINGGTFVGKFGIYIGSNTTVTINGGTFEGDDIGMYVGGTATINDGTFEGDDAGMYVVGGTVNLYGGTFNGGIESSPIATINLGNGYVYKDKDGVIYTELTAGMTCPDGAVVESETTAVSPASLSKAGTVTKTVENGRVVIVKEGVKYDLMGKRL